MTGKRRLAKSFLDDGPPLSPPTTPSSEKKKKSEFDHIIEVLEEDEKLVTAIDVHHEYSDDFKLERIVLPDQTQTPFVICRSPLCKDLPYKKRRRQMIETVIQQRDRLGYSGRAQRAARRSKKKRCPVCDSIEETRCPTCEQEGGEETPAVVEYF